MGKGAARLTEQALQKAIQKFLEQKSKPAHGKQTMRQLMKQNAGVSNIEITDANIKAFESTAKKYNIDFSLKKVKGEQTRYLVFFKGRDADVMTAAFQEFSAKKLNRDKKPSIRKALAAAKDKAKQLNAARDKVKKWTGGARYEAVKLQKLILPNIPMCSLSISLIRWDRRCGLPPARIFPKRYSISHRDFPKRFQMPCRAFTRWICLSALSARWLSV